MTIVDRTGRTNADYRAMWRRIQAALTEPASEPFGAAATMRSRAAFPSHDDVFSHTEIAASFDDTATWDGWVEG